MTAIDAAARVTSVPSTTGLRWATRADDLWVACAAYQEGTRDAGFVQRLGDRFVAVDGLGAALGGFDALEAAQRAVGAASEAFAASIWMRGA